MSETAAPGARSTATTSRGAATARRISASAVDLVLEHGYEATTVDMICAAVGISQRTFFNHFPTKDASIIGTEGPTLDESQVRAFITHDGPEILGDAIALIAASIARAGTEADVMRRRMMAISSSPVLMEKQIELFTAIERELSEIVRYRLARVSDAVESPDDIAEQARLTAHLIAGVMRYIAGEVMNGSPTSTADIVAATRKRLAALVPKLSGGSGTAASD